MTRLLTEQRNARIEPCEGLLIRTGIPHRSGKLAYHAFERGYATLVSANAFWNAKKGCFTLPGVTDLSETDVALDSAGFTSMALFAKKGRQAGIGGVFPWTYAQYLELASELNPSWYTQPDMCCEPELANSQDEIDYRVNATATMFEGCMRLTYAWQNHAAKDSNARVAANLYRAPVPCLQGWRASDYLRSLEMMLQISERWQPWQAPPVLIGVGSVCRRDLHHPEFGLFAILSALEPYLPKGAKLHLFGVKGTALARLREFACVASVDSLAWDLSARIAAHRDQVSNTLANRMGAMDDWMDKAQARAAKNSPQMRLSLQF
ncbi:deazapurine DNA modification protein DpdA family protein [Duganella vulcania]|uniref:DeoxyPurine in DNA protein A domain-containing protein n=1 Tax=Duganella vulcania TaxID=2692166 RepID=A0A845GGN4_9BURK|nr:hypothetical protein [Duganella vulcania]MYM92555.1 hypothetical protein [Duganella vulcania]